MGENKIKATPLKQLNYYSDKAPILIEGAMYKFETSYLVQQLTDSQLCKIGCWNYTVGRYKGYPLVVATTRVGMENSAACTALGIEAFHPMAIINQGTMGSYPVHLKLGDIILIEKSVNVAAFYTEPTPQGAGADYHDVKFMDLNTLELTPTCHYADKKLMTYAEQALQAYADGQIIKGSVASSNNFNSQIDKLLFLYEKFGFLGEEMETDAAAQVCEAYNVPFLSMRIISDSVINNEHFQFGAGDKCQQQALKVIEEIIKDK